MTSAGLPPPGFCKCSAGGGGGCEPPRRPRAWRVCARLSVSSEWRHGGGGWRDASRSRVLCHSSPLVLQAQRSVSQGVRLSLTRSFWSSCNCGSLCVAVLKRDPRSDVTHVSRSLLNQDGQL